MMNPLLNRKSAFISGWLLAILVLVLSPLSTAQVIPTGTISGVVRDPSGLLVPNASVSVINVASNSSRTAKTNGEGAYRLPALPIGQYTVKVDVAGFKSETETGLTLDVGQEAVANFTLQVGETQQEVVVQADLAQVDTTTSSLGHIVDSKQINELPLNGRNFIDLTLLQTGITQFSNNTFGTNALYGTFFSSNGAPIRSNMYTLDGAIMGNIQGASASSISGESLGLDGISEYRVMTNSYSAEYGLTMGSQTTIVTKPGTNQLHGDVFEYFRNSVLDARNYFDELYTLPTSVPGGGRRVAPFKRNQFGGSLGGPIQKDKTFFFGTYEGFRETLDNPSNIGITNTIPAACHTPVVAGVETVTSACDPSLAAGKTENVSAAMQPILALFPVPDLEPGDQFAYLSTQKTTEDYAQGRIDHTFSAKDSLFGRYTFDNTNAVYPRIFPIFDVGLVEKQQYFTLSENHVFSPNLLNSPRLSYSRSRVVSATPSASNPNTAQLSGPGYSCRAGLPICPINITAIANFSNSQASAIINVQNIFSFGDDIFWTKGKNGFKFGTLINRYDQYNNEGSGEKGTVTFTTLQSFLLGKYRSYTTYDPSFNSLKDMLFYTAGFYGQDDYRILPRLTLNLGLRYEFNTQPNERNGRQSYFVSPPYSNTVSLGPIVNDPSYTNFSPRLGFAWDVFGKGKTSLKGGFAILYDLSNIGAVFGLEGVAMPPFATSYVISPTTKGAPATLTFPLPIPAGIGTGGSLAGTSPTSVDRNYQSPHIYDYNLAVEQKLPFDMILNLAYAGSRGRNLFQPNNEANPFCPTTYKVVPQGCQGITTQVAGALPTWSTAAQQTCSDGSKAAQCRLNPFFSNFSLFRAIGISLYNALQVNLTKSLSHGLQFQVAYTYSKLLDDTEGIANADTSAATTSTLVDPYDPMVDYGPGNFDLRHNAHFNLTYHLRKFTDRPVTGKFINGWWTGSIVSLQTGQPLSATISTDREQAGIAGTQGGLERLSYVTSDNIGAVTAAAVAAGVTTCPANSTNCIPYNPVIYNPKTVMTRTVNQWVNPNMFTLQPLGTIGNVSRNTLREPGIATWDFSLNKDTALKLLGDSGRIEFRTEIFNILNHTNFGPTTNKGLFAGAITDSAEHPNSTAILSTSTPSREIQFSLKAVF